MSRRIITALGLLLVVTTGQAQSPDSIVGVTNARQVVTFLAELQRASRNGDRSAVAALIHYPVVVMIGGLRVPFTDAAALLERYDEIFTPALLDAIVRADAAVDRPQPGRVPMTVTADGLFIGTNALLIKLVGQQLRITSIVIPRDDTGDASLASRSETTTRAVRRQQPRRVGVRAGLRPTQFSGALLPGAADLYMLWVPKGQLLEVRLERVPSGWAVVRVVHAGTGAPLNPRVPDGARVVSGRAPESADYRIDVRRIGAGETTPLPYILSVSLR